MTQQQLENSAKQFVLESPWNYVAASEALRPELAGLKLFDTPIFGYADARDPLFAGLKQPEAVGPQFLLPEQWLEGAKSVLSFFLPFTDEVKHSNIGGDRPSPQWMHGRIEGQRMVIKLEEFVCGLLEKEGVRCVIPTADQRFRSVYGPDPSLEGEWQNASFTSNWSERHVAYIAGLGTFSLSKGLITPKGVAGRFGSLVVDRYFEPRPREYTGLYDYCIRCGACVKRCPAGAITLEQGKDHLKCAMLVSQTHLPNAPYYGCGKCQTGVPCERAIPRQSGDRPLESKAGLTKNRRNFL